MRVLRQVFPGLLIALLSVFIILGGLALSFAEGSAPASTRTPTPSQSATVPLLVITPATSTPTSVQPTGTFTPLISPTASQTLCPHPAGWVAYAVKPGETSEGLAARYQTTLEIFLQANCITEESLPAGSQVYVPPLPTPTSKVCGPPTGWVHYPVQHGDTLYRLSVAFGITVKELQEANCMGTSTLLVVGKNIYVPPWPPLFPTPTDTWVFPPTETWMTYVTDTETPTPTVETPYWLP